MLFKFMGSWYMNLSDNMGDRCLWKFNSMGSGVQKQVSSSPSRYFFGIVLSCFCFKFKTLKAAINNESAKAGLRLCFSVPLVQASQASLCCVLEQDTLILA